MKNYICYYSMYYSLSLDFSKAKLIVKDLDSPLKYTLRAISIQYLYAFVKINDLVIITT